MCKFNTSACIDGKEPGFIPITSAQKGNRKRCHQLIKCMNKNSMNPELYIYTNNNSILHSVSFFTKQTKPDLMRHLISVMKSLTTKA